MRADENKVDDAVLALLYITSFRERDSVRAWKGFDWDALDRLHEKGMIHSPRSTAKSVVFTDDGLKRAKELFESMLARPSA